MINDNKLNTPEITKMNSERIYELLKEMIFSQQLAPNEKINIHKLAKQIHTSIVPLREALSRLHSDKLVTMEPFKGYWVSEIINEKEKNDLFKARLLIEFNAMESIIVDQRLEVAEELEVLHQKMLLTEVDVSNSSYIKFNQLDSQFHCLLVQAGGNVFLTEAYIGMHCHLHLARLYHERGSVDKDEAIVEHKEIIEAIRYGDLSRAQHALRKHIIGSKTRLVNGLTAGADKKS